LWLNGGGGGCSSDFSRSVKPLEWRYDPPTTDETDSTDCGSTAVAAAVVATSVAPQSPWSGKPILQPRMTRIRRIAVTRGAGEATLGNRGPDGTTKVVTTKGFSLREALGVAIRSSNHGWHGFHGLRLNGGGGGRSSDFARSVKPLEWQADPATTDTTDCRDQGAGEATLANGGPDGTTKVVTTGLD
jgi:hypothetical protein